MAAAHVRNRMYCQRIRDTPYHLLTGKQPSVSQLHLFGSVCFTNVHLKKKLDPRCKKGCFVGYDKYSPSYLVYFPETKSVMKSGTVEFTERLDLDSSVSKSSPGLVHERFVDHLATPFETAQEIYGTPQETTEGGGLYDIAAADPVLVIEETVPSSQPHVTLTQTPVTTNPPSLVPRVETATDKLPSEQKSPRRIRTQPKR